MVDSIPDTKEQILHGEFHVSATDTAFAERNKNKKEYFSKQLHRQILRTNSFASIIPLYVAQAIQKTNRGFKKTNKIIFMYAPFSILS